MDLYDDGSKYPTEEFRGTALVWPVRIGKAVVLIVAGVLLVVLALHMLGGAL